MDDTPPAAGALESRMKMLERWRASLPPSDATHRGLEIAACLATQDQQIAALETSLETAMKRIFTLEERCDWLTQRWDDAYCFLRSQGFRSSGSAPAPPSLPPLRQMGVNEAATEPESHQDFVADHYFPGLGGGT